MQRQFFSSNAGWRGTVAGRVGAIVAMASLLLLGACETRSTVQENDLPEPGRDGVPPTLTVVSILPDGNVKSGDSVRIDFTASEALQVPIVSINGVPAEVSGSILSWSASRDITDDDPDGFVTFSIVYQDISGELGEAVTTTTDDSAACIGPECPVEGLGPLEGSWKLDFAGVGPAAGDTSWFSIADTGPTGPRACWFDDLYQFGADGSFANVLGDETYLETWQGVVEGCGAPIAPHDGSNPAAFAYDEDGATLTLTGVGAFLGLAKVINGGELASPADAPESVTYNVVDLVGDSLTINIDVGGGFWEFRLSRISNLPVVGNWKLEFAGIGPAAGDTSWFSIADTGPTGPRACWFDDIYHIGGDGSFRNFQQGDTYLETWQGVAEGCGAPVAPHDGSSAGGWMYDADEDALTITGTGSFIGLAKAFNGGELTDPADAVDGITYNIVDLTGDSLIINIDIGGGFWEFRLVRTTDNIALKGNWKLDFAGVGPAAGDTSWFSIADTGPTGPRACWFDDLYQFGLDGSFANSLGDETYLETWQGVAEGCGPPVAPHDGSNPAVFEYDSEGDTLTVTGVGAFMGLAKVINGGELTTPADAAESVTYNVVDLVGDSLTINIDVGGGFWEFRFSRVSTLPVVGNWKLEFAGVGPAAGDTSWFSIADTGPTGPRACWFDDLYHFSDDLTFLNLQQNETYLETWQGVAEGCGVPVAPHNGSMLGGWSFSETDEEVTVTGTGSYLGLAKTFNGGELTDPADAVDSITYELVEIIDGTMTIRIDVGGGWWEFDLVKQ